MLNIVMRVTSQGCCTCQIQTMPSLSGLQVIATEVARSKEVAFVDHLLPSQKLLYT